MGSELASIAPAIFATSSGPSWGAQFLYARQVNGAAWGTRAPVGGDRIREQRSDDVVLPAGGPRRLLLGPVVNQPLDIRTRDLPEPCPTEAWEDVEADNCFVSSQSARPLRRVVLEPPLGKLSYRQLPAGGVGPSPSVDIGLGTGEPSLGIRLGHKGRWSGTHLSGVPAAGLVTARGHLANAAEVATTGVWRVPNTTKLVAQIWHDRSIRADLLISPTALACSFPSREGGI